MIYLTKLDSTRILVNLESVKYVEAMPDTLIFFLNGESVIVKESLDAIKEAVMQYQAGVLSRSSSSFEL